MKTIDKRLILLITGMLLVSPFFNGYYTPECSANPCLSDNGLSFERHNVTLDIGDSQILFIGQDLSTQISDYFPQLLNNQSAIDIIRTYNETLMFIYRCPDSGHVALVGLNETHYVELLLTMTYTQGALGDITGIEIYCGESYLEQMKTAWLGVIAANESRNFNITSEFIPYLWSYDHTGTAFDSRTTSIIWSDNELTNLLYTLHWEFHSTAYLRVTVDPSSDPSSWYYEHMSVPVVLSVTSDGRLIQLLASVITLAIPPPNDNTTIIIVLGVGVVSLVALIAIFYRRR
ncbi:MAG: hypothetical protein ACTSUO_00215 [Candidatus Thorarchaeota archaeon]